MRNHSLSPAGKRPSMLLRWLLSMLLAAMPTAASAAELPAWEEVEQLVTRTLVTKNHPAGTLLTQSRAEEALKSVAALGWNVPGHQQLLARILPDTDFLAEVLSSRQGQRFAQEVAALPEGYDRLDHLRKLPRGEDTVRELIQGPDGYKMIEYMTTSTGGKNMGIMLSQDPHGAGFNRPTSRVYTVEQFLDQLQLRYRYESGELQLP